MPPLYSRQSSREREIERMASSSRVLRSLQYLATRTMSSMSTVEAVAQQMSREYGELVSYTPPVWARELSVVPRQRYVVSGVRFRLWPLEDHRSNPYSEILEQARGGRPASLLRKCLSI